MSDNHDRPRTGLLTEAKMRELETLAEEWRLDEGVVNRQDGLWARDVLLLVDHIRYLNSRLYDRIAAARRGERVDTFGPFFAVEPQVPQVPQEWACEL